VHTNTRSIPCAARNAPEQERPKKWNSMAGPARPAQFCWVTPSKGFTCSEPSDDIKKVVCQDCGVKTEAREELGGRCR
jgi:hypothetical protein